MNHVSASQGIEFMTFMGGLYGVILLPWAAVYAFKKQWKDIIGVFQLCLIVEGTVVGVGTAMIWPYFGLAWAVPTLIACIVWYLRIDGRRAETSHGQ